VDTPRRIEILRRHTGHSRRLQAVAAPDSRHGAGTFPFTAPSEHEPTPREVEVLQLISTGLVNREIGTILAVSEETVKSHVQHLLAKLRARSRAHAVAIGFRRGILS
jgi:DNA-binding CsgD family transcriptional regulator